MDQQILAKVCTQIYRRFPEVNGARPSVSPHGSGQYLLVFNGKGMAADGRTIPRTVRVVVSEDGKIGKTTTSR